MFSSGFSVLNDYIYPFEFIDVQSNLLYLAKLLNMNRYLFFVIAAIFIINFNASAQRTIAVPQIINYSYEVYKGVLQNWIIA